MTLLQDAHGEACPVGWTEGSATIKADPVEKLEYFSKVNGVNGTTNGTHGTTNGVKRPRTDSG